MVGFLYGGNTGLTYQDLQSRREAADALAKRIMGSQPKNVPEGIGALLMGAASGIGRYRADKGLSEGRAAASTQFDSILGRILGSDSAGSSGTAGAPAANAFGAEMPKSGMATELAATSPAKNFTYDPTIKSGITETASALGIDPVDLATAISYETGGTFDPAKGGPRTQWGRHKGLIQFGEPQAQKYGVDWENPVGSQLGADGAVAKYLRDTGVKPGMGLLDIYSAINAGGVGRYNASDANNGGAPGNVRDKVEKQMGGHRAKALAMFAAQAEADPQAAIDAIAPPSGAVMPPAAPQASAYVDPKVSAPNYNPAAANPGAIPTGGGQASIPGPQSPFVPNPVSEPQASLPSQQPSPALPPLPSRDVAMAPPVAAVPPQGLPQQAQAPQQVAQAAPQQFPRMQPYRPNAEMLKLLSNPFLDEGQKGALRMVMQQDMQQHQAQQEQQIWQARQDYETQQRRSDPAYQANIEQTRAQTQRLREGTRPLTTDERRAWGIPETDTRPYAMAPGGKPELIGASGQTINVGGQIEARKQAAETMGLKPDDPRYMGYVLNGELPKESQQNLTAIDKKAIQDADDLVAANQSALDALGQAEGLSSTANSGWLAGTRASIGNNLPDWMVPDMVSSPESSRATTDMDNAIIGQAVTQLKTIFGGNPTEGERAILLELQGSSTMPRDVRKNVFARAKALATKRLEFNQNRAKDLRGGDYYKPNRAPATGTNVDDLLKKYGGQ